MSNNLIVHKLWMQNFMSYGKKRTEIQLDGGGMTLIKGVNLDDTVNGIGANGVGKSTIINAIVYAFYGESIGDSKLDELINDVNKNKCIVGIEFSIGDDRYVIERFRKMKAGAEGTYTNIFKNEDIDKDADDKSRTNLAKATLPETNKFTKELVGMPKELFIRLVVFDADEVSFFKLGAALQREVMENLFQITILSEKAEFFREEQKEVKKEIEIQENNIRFLEQKVEEHEEALASAERRVKKFDIASKDELEELKDDLAALQKIDVDEEREIFAYNAQLEEEIAAIKEQQQQLSQPLMDARQRINDYEHDLDKVESKISSILRDKKRKQKEIDALQHKIDAFKRNTCPECSQALPDAGIKIEEAERQVQHLNDELDDLHISYNNYSDSKAPIEDEIAIIEGEVKDISARQHQFKVEINEVKSKFKQPSVRNVDQLTRLESKIEVTQQKIKDLENATNPHIDALEELQSKSVEEIDYTEINDLKKLLDHQKFMLKLLTDKKSFLRQRLINKRLPYLNERLTHYLTSLGLPYQVEFQSDLTAKIKRRGKTKSFANLSHGQKARVNFALSFAFRDVMERINRKVSVCLLDEVLDKALCDVGANAAITMIHEKCKRDKLSIFVITHKKEIANRFHNIMTVTMENGFSHIK